MPTRVLQVGRLVDSGVGVDEVVPVSEASIGKDRDRHEGIILPDAGEVRPQGELTDVELGVFQHSTVSLWRGKCENGGVDAFDFDIAADQRPRSVDLVDCDGEVDIS